MNLATGPEPSIDLEWNDDHVIPPNYTPDLVFLFDRMIEETIGKVDPAKGDKVLDIGCGRAVDTIQVAQKGGKPVGLEPSRTMLGHSKKCIADSGVSVALVQGIGEYLPFKSHTFDWVMCKGALDHFPDPCRTIEEISRVLKPEGKAVISIANFESLGHRLARNSYRVAKFILRKDSDQRQAWETPLDHTVRFDYPLIKKVVGSHLEIEESVGISLLWGAPYWNWLIDSLPNRVSFAVMGTLDRFARHLPGISDVVLVKCRQKHSHH